MANGTKLSNLVSNIKLNEVQLNTLEKINSIISKTAGPYGSYTMIMHQNALTEYSKDGHKVLSNIKFFRPLEKAVHDELLGITEHVIKKVGDGTTTAVQLSYYIYHALLIHTHFWDAVGITPYTVISTFQDVVEKISDIIKEHGRQTITPEDIYEICMISTNGNDTVSRDISNIYKKYNMEVFIELNTSNTESSVVKEYDGIILNKGFSSPSFINRANNTVEIQNPNIYYFQDPVDTPDMTSLLMNIFIHNIYEPYQDGTGNYIPTIILCPTITQDIAGDLKDIEQIFYSFDQANSKTIKPPFCIISGLNDRVDNIEDIVTLCDIPAIRKYINPEQQKKDIEEGKAPSKDTVYRFCGHAESVIVDIDKTKIINPAGMYVVTENGDREYSPIYNALISFLEEQIRIETEAKINLNLVAQLKKRLHSLTSNFVEYYVGGVSAADRDNIKDLVEDAILNCRSALEYGIGYGAGFEGLRASLEYQNTLSAVTLDWDEDDTDLTTRKQLTDMIFEAYRDIMLNLYKSAMSTEQANTIMDKSLELGRPYNIREKSFDGLQVYTSIETDPAILNAISKIITIMYTANQALIVDPMQNVYIEDDEE